MAPWAAHSSSCDIWPAGPAAPYRRVACVEGGRAALPDGALAETMCLAQLTPQPTRRAWREQMLGNCRLANRPPPCCASAAHLLNQAATLLRKHRAELAAAGRGAQAGFWRFEATNKADVFFEAHQLLLLNSPAPLARRPRSPAQAAPPPPEHGHTEGLVLLCLASLLCGGTLQGAPRAGQHAEGACRGRRARGVGSGWQGRTLAVRHAGHARR